MKGKEWQDAMIALAQRYEKARVLVMRKVDPPTRIIGKGRIIYLDNPFLDFAGSLVETGRAVFIEAKETGNGKLRINHDSGVKKRQMHSLRVWHYAGAVAAVVWRSTAGFVRPQQLIEPRTYFLPVDWILMCIEKRKRSYISEVEDVPIQLRNDDWIKTLLEHLKHEKTKRHYRSPLHIYEDGSDKRAEA